MTGVRRIFLDDSYFSSMDTAPTNVNVIICKPLLYDFVHSGAIQGQEVISLQGVVKTELTYAGRDSSAGNAGKYCFNGADNTLCLLVDPAVVTTDALAKSYMTGILIVYNMIDLEYFGSTELYTMTTTYSNGTSVGSTNPTTFDVLSAKIAAYDNDINVNDIGFYEHKIIRSLEAV